MFAGFARDHVLVIDVRARDENLAFALFEPLNATGLPLTALETFKPLVVHSEGQPNYSASPSASSLGAVEKMLSSLTASKERIRLTSELLTAFALAQTGEKLGYSLFEQRMWLHRAYIRPRENGSQLATRRLFVAELRHTAEFLLGPWHRHDQQLCHLPAMELSEEDRLNLLVLSASRHVVVCAATRSVLGQGALGGRRGRFPCLPKSDRCLLGPVADVSRPDSRYRYSLSKDYATGHISLN